MKKYKVKKYAKGVNEVLSTQAANKGAAMGVISSAADMAIPGLGSALSAANSIAGAVLKDDKGLYKGKLMSSVFKQKALRDAYKTEEDEVLSKNYNQAVSGIDYTQGQTRQYKKGGTTKSKVIEIEGKRTPEIHTDKNFNLKNLGTTPHSLGGDLVVAEEGDVVFPTQNSPKKYKEVMTAINKGDKYKLKKEQSKLPEDKATKYDDGTKKVKKFNPLTATEAEYRAYKLANTRKFSSVPKLKLNNSPVSDNKPAAFTTGVAKSSPTMAAKPAVSVPQVPVTAVKPKVGTKTYKTQKTAQKATKGSPLAAVASSIAMPMGNGSTKEFGDTLPGTSSAQILAVKNSDVNNTINETNDIAGSETKGSKLGNALGTAGKYAGIVNNLVQGLKPAEKTKRNYTRSNTIGYNDMSDPSRRESRQAMTGQIANARNLSGGNAGNVRSNAANAYAQNADRLDKINQGELGRFDQVQQANTQIKNADKQFNAQVDMQADDMDARSRAAKQSYIDTAMGDISQVAQINEQTKYLKSRDAKADEMGMLELGVINSQSPYKMNAETGAIEFHPNSPGAVYGMAGNGGVTTKVASKVGNTTTTTTQKPVTSNNWFDRNIRRKRYSKGTKAVKYKKK